VQEGSATATLAFGCILGCVIAGTVSDKFGRKKGLMLAAAIFLFSSLWMAFSHNSTIFIIARFAAGIDSGHAVWPCDQRFHLILNLAIGGGLGGRKGIDNNLFPQVFEIDYVRVYQKNK